jgi:hypothetical protein
LIRYLRLNGFLLLPHLTVLAGGQHGHVDIIGLRATGSAEVSRELNFRSMTNFSLSLARANITKSLAADSWD